MSPGITRAKNHTILLGIAMIEKCYPVDIDIDFRLAVLVNHMLALKVLYQS